jgi:hypothetical protein
LLAIGALRILFPSSFCSIVCIIYGSMIPFPGTLWIYCALGKRFIHCGSGDLILNALNYYYYYNFFFFFFFFFQPNTGFLDSVPVTCDQTWPPYVMSILKKLLRRNQQVKLHPCCKLGGKSYDQGHHVLEEKCMEWYAHFEA